jgi:hypothetical protein
MVCIGLDIDGNKAVYAIFDGSQIIEAGSIKPQDANPLASGCSARLCQGSLVGNLPFCDGAALPNPKRYSIQSKREVALRSSAR